MKPYLQRLDEILTDDQKEKAIVYGLNTLEEEEIGDYTLVLFKDTNITPELKKKIGTNIQLGLQRNGFDMFNNQHQNKKLPFTSLPLTKLKDFKAILNKWINKYHKILAGSNNAAKMKPYQAILERLGFKVTVINTEVHNHNLLLIEKKNV